MLPVFDLSWKDNHFYSCRRQDVYSITAEYNQQFIFLAQEREQI